MQIDGGVDVEVDVDCSGLLRSSPEPIQSEDKAISLATTPRNRLKGMRRRAAKLLARIKADSFDYPTDCHHTVKGISQGGCLPSPLNVLLDKLQHRTENDKPAGMSCPTFHIITCMRPGDLLNAHPRQHRVPHLGPRYTLKIQEA